MYCALNRTLGDRGFFVVFVAKPLSASGKATISKWQSHYQQVAKPLSASGKAAIMGKSHFHAILKPNSTPNWFLQDLFVFVI